MEGLLSRLAEWVRRHRKAIVLVWLALLVGGTWFSLHQQDHLSGGGWDVKGSQSQAAIDAIKTFPGYASSDLAVVVSGTSREDVAARMDHVRRELARHPQLRPGPAQPLPDRRSLILPITAATSYDEAISISGDLREELVQTTPQVTTRVIGQAAIWSSFRETTKEQLAKGELLGFPIILIILLAGFGTAVAALAPLVLGFVAVFLTGALIYWLSRVYPMSVFVSNMASMIGIGVAVDYSLFIVSRFRRELGLGATREEALRRAYATSGTAVVFSGATVAISLAGLLLIPLKAIQSMAIGAIIVVLVAVLGAVTLLGAILFIAGGSIERFRIRLPWQTGSEEGGKFWEAWSNKMLAHPVRAVVIGTAGLLLLASPIFSIKLAVKGAVLLPETSDVREGSEYVQRQVGPGIIGPVQLVTSDRETAAEVRDRLAGFPGIARVDQIRARPDGKLFLTEALLADDPEGFRAQDTYEAMLTAVRPIAERQGSDLALGGVTAHALDIKAAIVNNIWKVIVFVLISSYVVLVLLLRSLLLPLKAVLMNILSVAASYGVLVAVFQHGWLDWTGYNSPGYIDTFVPPLILAVTFGLSMDYEVFLLTRIRERYKEVGSEASVSEGLRLCARIITSAALIMVGVFGAFSIAGSIQLRELGIGLAVAVILDATVVRLILVPATMQLLGDWNWWLPTRLERLLPTVERG